MAIDIPQQKHGLISTLLPVAGSVAGGFFGGPAGAKVGGALGGKIGAGMNASIDSQNQANANLSGSKPVAQGHGLIESLAPIAGDVANSYLDQEKKDKQDDSTAMSRKMGGLSPDNDPNSDVDSNGAIKLYTYGSIGVGIPKTDASLRAYNGLNNGLSSDDPMVRKMRYGGIS